MKKLIFVVVVVSFFASCGLINKKGYSRLQQTHFIWNNGFALEVDHSFRRCNYLHRRLTTVMKNLGFIADLIAPRDVQTGAIFYLKPSQLESVYKYILKRKNKSVGLVIADSDKSTPSDLKFDFDEIIHDPVIHHCFVQNCDYMGSSAKVSPLPIGIDFHTLTERNIWEEDVKSTRIQELCLHEVINQAVTIENRDQRVFVDFHLHESSKRFKAKGYDTRTDVMNYFEDDPFIVLQEDEMKREEQWKERAKYAFSLCHIGNGMDCHRTWESLALGSIVIVKSSPLDPLYEGLPIVIVDDWSEVCESNLETWSDL